MRKVLLVLSSIAALAALSCLSGGASAAHVVVKLTSEQVANVCGKRVESGGGHTGCSTSCGNGKHICNFDCNNKTKQCGGECLTCEARKFPWGDKYWIHVVNKTVKAAQ